jgi:hypothetical protein
MDPYSCRVLGRLRRTETTMENYFRFRAGQEGYDVSFIEQYVLPVIYPAGLTRNIQLILAGIVIAINAIIYTAILLRKKKLP